MYYFIYTKLIESWFLRDIGQINKLNIAKSNENPGYFLELLDTF